MKPDAVHPARLRLLVLDDDMISRLVLAELARSLGHEAEEIDNAAEAVERAASGAFDALLVDLSMPEADGFEILRRLRARETAQDSLPLPVIAVTGHVGAEDHARTQAAGFCAHLDKPVQRMVLQEILARLAPPHAPPPAQGGAAVPADVDEAALTHGLLRLAGHRGGDARFLHTLVQAFAQRSAGLAQQLERLVAEPAGADADLAARRTDILARLRACALAVGAIDLTDRCRDPDVAPAALAAQFEAVAHALARIVEHRHPSLLKPGAQHFQA